MNRHNELSRICESPYKKRLKIPHSSLQYFHYYYIVYHSLYIIFRTNLTQWRK
jgi:hypothetical protein